MQYMLLIYNNEASQAAMSEADRNNLYQDYGAYTAALQASGAMVAGDALQPISTASTVAQENGKPFVTDGPFAETKEQLGGYYLIDVATIDEALEWAGKIPSVRVGGKIEVRPVMSM